MKKTVPKKVLKGTASATSSSLVLAFQRQTANARAAEAAEQAAAAVAASQQAAAEAAAIPEHSVRALSQTGKGQGDRTVLVHPPKKHASPRLELRS